MKDQDRTPYTGAAAIAISHTFTSNTWLHEIRLKLTGGVGAGGDLLISVDSALGAAYDVLLSSDDMTTVTDFIWDDIKKKFFTGDKLIIAWTNPGNKTYGLELRTEPVDW